MSTGVAHEPWTLGPELFLPACHLGQAGRGRAPAPVVLEALARLLASSDFDGTPRSRAFLRFVVEEDTRVRTPFKKNWDVSFQKNTRMGTGSKVLMLWLELINAFNDPNFLGPNTSFGSSNFGRITTERGFPRLVQLMVRFAF